MAWRRQMKQLHGGSDEFKFVKQETVPFEWKFEDVEDHEHPYILTVTVAGQTRSEGCREDLSSEEAAAKARSLAHEVYATSQS
jgi:hypothetical protein